MTRKIDDTYYGISTEKLNQVYPGDLTYVNTFCVKDEYRPVAVYEVATPDRSKGHCDYLLIQVVDGSGYVRGMDREEMTKYRLQDAIRCRKCGDVVYSINRHHNHFCACGAVAIDGGRDYTKISGSSQDFDNVTFDLLNNEISSKVLD